MKLLIGGSPCTYWSIAQTKHRETEASGIGWELFRNYLIAREKYKPDYFLYENNKSMSAAIREQITRELGVEPVLIDSALVSAQNRQRLYWVGKRNPDGAYSQVHIEQPEDRGILLRDILESGLHWQEKAHCLKTQWRKGGLGEHKQGFYSVPVECDIVITKNSIRCQRRDKKHSTVQGSHVNFDDAKSQTLSVAHIPKVIEAADSKTHPAYEVQTGKITINGKQYPIKLSDGFYIIRKLTVRECMRLQTVPEDYLFPVSDSQAYKMLGNGWTVEVITHILSHIPGIQTNPLDVLSMYDGMSCGRLALNRLGANVQVYYVTEIDKFAIQTTQANFPDVVQLGDAFQVREDGWTYAGLTSGTSEAAERCE